MREGFVEERAHELALFNGQVLERGRIGTKRSGRPRSQL